MESSTGSVPQKSALTDLAVAAKDGSKEAQNRFLRALLPVVRGAIRSVLVGEPHRHDEAEGYALEKLAERYEVHLSKFDPTLGPAEGYYRRISTRLVYRFIRHEKADVRKIAHAVCGEIDVATHAGDSALELELENRGLLRIFRQIVDALDPIDKQVVWRRGVEDIPAKVVAELMGRTPVWVDQRYKRARVRIIAELEQKTGESIANLLALIFAFLTLHFINGTSGIFV